MIELIKKEIHINRQRGTAVSQLTLDDDFIVPDALDDTGENWRHGRVRYL